MTPYYEQDGITIYHADCRDVLPTLADGSVDLVLTDPPYGIGLANHDSTGTFRKHRSWDVVGDDGMAAATTVSDWAAGRRLPIVLFCSPDAPLPGEWRSRLVWHKPGLGMGGDPGRCWRRDWELILVRGTGPLNGGRDSAILRYELRPSEFAHPCQKPLALCAYLIRKTTQQGARVFDPFVGSGTTLIAAKAEGRKAIGIEIEERYCEIAARRLAQGVFDFEPKQTATDEQMVLDVAVE
jgi:site-specific DNA-methyltransferase (adenine-specific)